VNSFYKVKFTQLNLKFNLNILKEPITIYMLTTHQA